MSLGGHIVGLANKKENYNNNYNNTTDYVISKLTVQDDVVFDPLMGAARTGVAALRLKRRFIGSEKDKDTFALAEATINRELSYIGAKQ
jgi:DNA modification methylase